MTRFTTDNSEGYTAEQLATLNARFDAHMAANPELADSDIVDRRQSYEDLVAEMLLAEFDAA